MVRAELARLTATTMSRIALIALMLVPVLYGGLYLWANHDPYAGLDRVPVALVVADNGATIDGARHNYGDEVADQLVADGTFEWHRVSASMAKAGVADASYDFGVTIPADFSEAISSPAGDSPRQATVTLTTNDTNSYLASTIGNQAAKSIREAIVQKVNRQAAGRLLVGLSDIRSHLVTAVDGASQLTEGAAGAHDGGTRLASGPPSSPTAPAGWRPARARSPPARARSRPAPNGSPRATRSSPPRPPAPAQGPRRPRTPSSGRAGTSRPNWRRRAWTRRASTACLPPSIRSTPTCTPETRVCSRSSARSIGSPPAAPRSRTGRPRPPPERPAPQDGAAQAATGAGTLASGAGTLRDGLGSLQEGAGRLRDGLQTGVDGVPHTDKATRDLQAKTIADPVDLHNAAVTSAGTYGAGLAPFFASLAAWIGIYALFLIVKPVSRRAITALHSPLKITLAGWLTPGILGAIQMAALFAVFSGVLGFEVHNPAGTYALMTLAALTFAAIILTLNVWLGSVGQFLGLVLMVVQLVTAGGTFPWQTLPAPLAWLHQVVPMSYAVDGIRQLMYGGNPATAWSDAGVLLLWLGGALVLAAIGVIRMTHFRTLRDLRPSLIG